jgi:hypothetical protein
MSVTFLHWRRAREIRESRAPWSSLTSVKTFVFSDGVAWHFRLSLLVMAAMFTLVYKTLPNAYVAWGDAWVGAVATALLFNVGSLLMSTLVSHTRGSVYGTAASVLGLLAWVYYSAQVFFFGAALTRIFATTHGGRIVPVHRALGRELWRRAANRRSARMLRGAPARNLAAPFQSGVRRDRNGNELVRRSSRTLCLHSFSSFHALVRGCI